MASQDVVDVPEDLRAALAADAQAERAFAVLPRSHKAEYLKWIGEARKPETRARHVGQTIDRLRGGR
jgi:uncharacterized protein YdeI (YjbR/CyaY-like superfamily)